MQRRESKSLRTSTDLPSANTLFLDPPARSLNLFIVMRIGQVSQ